MRDEENMLSKEKEYGDIFREMYRDNVNSASFSFPPPSSSLFSFSLLLFDCYLSTVMLETIV